MSPALSFSCEEKKQALINKECSQTIRPPRENPIEVGNKLWIYWRQRVPAEKKNNHFLGLGVVTEVHDIVMGGHFVEGSILSDESVEEIAKKDGFESEIEFEEWFNERYGLDEAFSKPKSFRIIRWRWIEEGSDAE